MITFKEHFWLSDTIEKTLGFPLVKKTGKIEYIEERRNPITVQLSDGTRLSFTYDEYRKIHGKPEQGKKMTVMMIPGSPYAKIINCFIS